MLPKGGWPSPHDMREAAKRKGMPGWQSSSIMQMADVVETTQMTLTPIKLRFDELMNDIMEWLKEHTQAIIHTLMSLIVLALLVAVWLLLREARVGLWLYSRFDYLRLGLLRLHAPGNAGVFQYYQALQRLMDVQGMSRTPTANTSEYLGQIGHRFDHLRRELIEITFLFERARYGNREINSHELSRVRQNYQRVFEGIDRLHSV